MSVKIVLRKKQKADGTYPLAIRITVDRKSTYTYVGQSILEKDWDEDAARVRKSHPNSARLNNFLLTKLAEANDRLLELNAHKDGVSSRTVKQSLRRKGATFFAVAEERLALHRQQGKFSVETNERSILKMFRLFLGGRDLAFTDMTVSLLGQFKGWLEGERQVSAKTVSVYFKYLHAIYSEAIKSDPNLAKHKPFGKDGFSVQTPETIKIGLTAAEVKRIEEVPLKGFTDHTRNVWLMSFYFAGMRCSDVLMLRWGDFQDGRLHYAMGKNKKPGSVKAPEKALLLLERYRERADKTGLVFPDIRTVKDLDDKYQVQRRCRSVNRKLNNHLKKIAAACEIDKPLSMHISRHSFGTISGDKIPVQMLQKLYRHSSVQTTIGYQSAFIHKGADDAIDAVTGF